MYFDVVTKSFREEDREADKLAFVASDVELSWRQLKTLSDHVCQTIEKINIPAGNPVLVYGDKEAFFLAAILSCYRKGLPFVPLSPELPSKRIEKIIQQTASNVIIVCGDYSEAPVLPVTLKSDEHAVSASLVTWPSQHKDIAHILFTSGSSGEPKGVLITHENISEFTNWFLNKFQVTEKTVFINQASFLFDISLADFFGALQTGATAVFNSRAQISDPSFFERIQKYKGNYWNSTPSFLTLCLANKDFNASSFVDINCFTLSGENLSSALVKQLRARFPDAKIINAYGPTETCIFVSFAEISKEMPDENFLPISKLPAPNISLETNEIVITGKQVGKGYLNGITFGGKFKTGDLALEKNNFLYCKGRRDEQVKFNGYRIELDEIKASLEDLSFVHQAECIPITIDGKIKRLVAFVKLYDATNVQLSHIKSKLRDLLPHYMIPGEIIAVKEFPLTTSAKTDKEKLVQNYLDLST